MQPKNSNRVYKNIGSKVKDYHWIYVNIGPLVAKSALESSYGNDAEEIFKGLEVYHQYGMDVYMNPKDEREN